MERVRDRLLAQLNARREKITERRGWYTGAALPAPLFSSQESAAFARFQRMAKTNFLGAATDVYADRLRIVGVHRHDVDLHDVELWDTWRRARITRDASDVQRDALALGWGYLLTLPHPRRRGEVMTRRLDPAWAITEPWADDPAEARYGLVIAKGEDGHRLMRLYATDSVWTWRSKHPVADNPVLSPANAGQYEAVGERVPTQLGAVPVVEFGDGGSILERGVTHQIRANQSALHHVAIERQQSFRRLILLNVQFERDADNKPIPPRIPNDPSKIMMPTGTDVKPWESTPTTGTDLLRSYEEAIRHLCGAIGVPAHYILPAATGSISADALRLSEAVFRARLQAIADRFTESWDHVLRVILAATDTEDRPASVVYSLILPQEASLVGDSIRKMTESGLPLRSAIIGTGCATPAEADRMVAARDSHTTQTPASDR